MRDKLALWVIRLAARLTTWGDTYDALCVAEYEQQWWLARPTEERKP